MTKKKGSPYFFCKYANEFAPNNYLAILVNQNKKHHNTLTSRLNEEIKKKKYILFMGIPMIYLMSCIK